jgi:hypothetical protein
MENLFPSLRPKWTGDQVKSASSGDNCLQLKEILKLYSLPKQTIYDVTWGLGAMWKGIDTTIYNLKSSDLVTPMGAGHGFTVQDFCNLDYDDSSGDILILDPPYMAGKQTHKNLAAAYHNNNDNHNAVLRLYLGGIIEAHRVLKHGGRVFVKCQDELSGGKQHWTHCEVMDILTMTGFDVVDLFVLVNETGRLMAGHAHQTSARKNHSYWIIGAKAYARPTKRKDGPKKIGRKLDFGNET